MTPMFYVELLYRCIELVSELIMQLLNWTNILVELNQHRHRHAKKTQ